MDDVGSKCPILVPAAPAACDPIADHQWGEQEKKVRVQPKSSDWKFELGGHAYCVETRGRATYAPNQKTRDPERTH